MPNELVRAVINNIARENIDTKSQGDLRDKYEIQKSVSLSKYSSSSKTRVKPTSSSYNKNKTTIDLNILANRIRGVDGEDKTAGSTRDNKVKTNKLTLDQLSKLSKGKDEGSSSSVTSTTINLQKGSQKNNFSLESLTQSIKKNI